MNSACWPVAAPGGDLKDSRDGFQCRPGFTMRLLRFRGAANLAIDRKICSHNGQREGLATMIESLTSSETAFVAGVSVRDVDRMIDEHIPPEGLYTATQTRSFKS
jgi:hypothetical protein